MKIALDARPLIRSQIQGAEQRARNILAAWAAAEPEHEFYLIFPRPTGDPAIDESLLATLPPNFHRAEISSFTLPSSFHSGTRFLNALARAIGRVEPDVYHSFTPYVPRVSTCPVVPTVHDLAFELDPVVRRTPVGRQLRQATAHAVKYARRIVAVSSQTKSDLAFAYGLAPDMIDVIYNGIDPAFSPLPAGTIATLAGVHTANDILGPYVLSVGADIPRRNYSRALEAMRIVWKSPSADARRTKWVLAGRDDWTTSPIYAAAQHMNLLDRLRFVKAPTNAELADLYRSATLTCCASSFEGFGLSVLESLACGTSVACSDMRSLREVAEQAAVYFAHDDAAAMGEAIVGLIEDAEYRRQLKYRGIKRAAIFTWTQAARQTLVTLEVATARTAHPDASANRP